MRPAPALALMSAFDPKRTLPPFNGHGVHFVERFVAPPDYEAFASATLAMWRVVHEDRGLNELHGFLSQADTIARSPESNR